MMEYKYQNSKIEKSRTGIAVTLKELIDLRIHAMHDSLRQKNNLRHLSGQKLAPIRGRGIEFDSTREYQAGDDIRNMAWRITARSLKPYIKVYHEAKERPVWLAVDLSPSLYFGTRTMFKSVKSIEHAACLGWTYLLKREQIGALIATSGKVSVYSPQMGENNFLKILKVFSDVSAHFPSFVNDENYFHYLLNAMRQQIRAGHTVFIISDFFKFDEEAQKLILHMAMRAEIILVFVYDPFEAEAPPPYQYILTNGQQRFIFDMENTKNRLQYQQQFQAKKNELMLFAQKHHISLKILCTEK